MANNRTPAAQFALDLSRGSLPVILVCTMLAAVAVGAYNIGSIINQMQTDKRGTDEKFTSIDVELKTIRGLLQGSGFLTENNFDRWCRLSETLNKGWKCPPPLSQINR